ncbi:MAG: hypothetical protein WC413_00480 [Candidatus Nanoarchaeia archaeon]
MSESNYVIVGVISLMAGVGIGGNLAQYITKPQCAYVRDLSNKGSSDIVVTNTAGTKFIFLQQNDGTYKLLDNIKKEKKQVNEQEINQLEQTINDKTKDLK